jgi:effector-binding domain-containing protein
MKELPNLPPSNNNYTIGVISQKENPAQTFIGYFIKDKIENLPALFAEYMPQAGMYAVEQKLAYTDYTPGAVYTKFDEVKGETELYIGLMLSKKIAPKEGMDSIDIPEGGVVTISKFGNYGEGDMEAHTNIANYFNNKNLEYGNLVWELYVNDPTTVKPEEIQTDIYYQIK